MWALFSFHGRTSRLGFWRVQLLCVAVSAATMALASFAMTRIGPIAGVLFLALLPAAVIDVAVYLRRLHDRGKNVWWLLLFNLGPLFMIGLARQLVEQGSAAAVLVSLPLVLAGLGIDVWGWVECGFLRSQPTSNQFGEPPALGAMAPGI